MPDDLAATLTGIRDLIAARDDLAVRTNWDVPDDVSEFNAAQDKLAARVPSLLAALDAVLEIHEEFDGQCSSCYDGYGDEAAWPCAELRAITTALTGTPQLSEDENHG